MKGVASVKAEADHQAAGGHQDVEFPVDVGIKDPPFVRRRGAHVRAELPPALLPRHIPGIDEHGAQVAVFRVEVQFQFLVAAGRVLECVDLAVGRLVIVQGRALAFRVAEEGPGIRERPPADLLLEEQGAFGLEAGGRGVGVRGVGVRGRWCGGARLGRGGHRRQAGCGGQGRAERRRRQIDGRRGRQRGRLDRKVGECRGEQRLGGNRGFGAGAAVSIAGAGGSAGASGAGTRGAGLNFAGTVAGTVGAAAAGTIAAGIGGGATGLAGPSGFATRVPGNVTIRLSGGSRLLRTGGAEIPETGVSARSAAPSRTCARSDGP
ncbi:hypothetical protein SBA4_3390008 [Candidatus Sulfopaludibacter sp. SbA4]|nr:hypothetical protein SBA4_3390008 [Candidatus Sulfopaludibacter sp. SbA4]